MLVRRLFTFLVLAVLLIGVLIDPYTFRLNNADASPSTPLWQAVFGMVDIVLLVVAAAFGFEGNAVRTVQMLTLETGYNVFLSIVYLGQSGLQRYAEHFGHHEYLTLYLCLIGLRLLLILIWTPVLPDVGSSED